MRSIAGVESPRSPSQILVQLHEPPEAAAVAGLDGVARARDEVVDSVERSLDGSGALRVQPRYPRDHRGGARRRPRVPDAERERHADAHLLDPLLLREEKAAPARRDRGIHAARVAVEDALPRHDALCDQVCRCARVDRPRDRDAERRRASEAATGGEIDERFDGEWRVELARLDERVESAPEIARIFLGDLGVPGPDSETAEARRAGLDRASDRAHPPLDPGGERGDAVHDGMLPEENDLSAGGARSWRGPPHAVRGVAVFVRAGVDRFHGLLVGVLTHLVTVCTPPRLV